MSCDANLSEIARSWPVRVLDIFCADKSDNNDNGEK